MTTDAGTDHTTDRIERSIDIQAPRARVWRALADAAQFGAWFGVSFDGPFTPGARLTGTLTDPDWAHVSFAVVVERIEPESLFTYRWHPFAVEPGVDYEQEPMTLVEFQLDEVPGGTRLTVVESGFDGIPPERRGIAFRMNDQGWAEQVRRVAAYVT
ncbi:MAG TPA: SRPBCC family protein [Thermomicrobiaceae bacterium]|nr:SRPBCC family protein [Thermomicrobiaceae bacterium]